MFLLSEEVFCPIVGCGARLKSLEDFEDHYNARHVASCSVCSRAYPTSRLLGIHVSEAHDSFFQAKVARGFAMVCSFFSTDYILQRVPTISFIKRITYCCQILITLELDNTY